MCILCTDFAVEIVKLQGNSILNYILIGVYHPERCLHQYHRRLNATRTLNGYGRNAGRTRIVKSVEFEWKVLRQIEESDGGSTQ